MLGLKLNHVSERSPWFLAFWGLHDMADVLQISFAYSPENGNIDDNLNKV